LSRSGPSNFPDTSLFSLHFQRLRRLRVYHPAPVRSHDPQAGQRVDPGLRPSDIWQYLFERLAPITNVTMGAACVLS